MELEENAHTGLSDKQIQLLQEFRIRVQDVLTKQEHDDFYLLRWLRARNYDLKKSELMLRKSMEWRKKWKADTLTRDWTPPDVLKKYYPSGMSGFDKEGCPVWIYPAKGLHMKSLSMAVKKSDIIRYNIVLMETIHGVCKVQSAKLGRRVDKAVLLDDLSGFSLKQLFMPGMDIILKFLSMIEANYPETLKAAYVFNGPLIFPVIYRLVKPLLSEDTKKKICVLGHHWQEKVLSVIDEDQLPVHWGGTATDPDGDPYCRSKICLGGEVPPELYLKGSHLVEESKVSRKTLCKGDSLELAYSVASGEMALKWVFWTESHDVRFGLRYYPEQGPPEVIIPDARVNCHHVPEDGLHKCEKPGTYKVKFDNSYSWVNSKRLSYSIEVVNMEEIQTDTESMISCSSGSTDPEAFQDAPNCVQTTL